MSLQINRKIKSPWVPEELSRQWNLPRANNSQMVNEVRGALEKYDQKKVPLVRALYDHAPFILTRTHFKRGIAYQTFIELDYMAECATKKCWEHREELPNIVERDFIFDELSRATKEGLTPIFRVSREILKDKKEIEFHRLSLTHGSIKGINVTVDIYSPGAFTVL